MRRFELGDSHWSITVSKGVVDLVWGDPDRPEQRHHRRFGSDQLASTFFEGQIARQRALGYVEVFPDVRYADQAGDVPPEPPRARSIRFEVPAEKPSNFKRYPQPAAFREIEQQDRLLIELDGELDDHTKTKRREETFATIAAASEAYDECVESLREDGGWRQIRSSVVRGASREPLLEAECLAAGDDPAPWAVYADWLLEHGDPLGELATCLDGEANARFDSAMSELGVSEHVQIVRTHGFPRAATIKFEDVDGADPARLADAAKAVCASSEGRFIEVLRLGLGGYTDSNDWAPTLRALAETAHPERIRELYFNEYAFTDCEISWATMGDLTGLFTPFPNLEVLHLKSGAGGVLGALDLPSLRTFIRESGGLAASEITSILEAKWPHLAHLELWFGSTDYGAGSTVVSIRSILDGSLPSLRHLGIVNCEWVEDAIDALARSQVLPQLSSLDLSRGILAQRGVALLREHAAAFRHLASIDLSANLLTAGEAVQIREVLDNVILNDQRERDPYYEEDEADGEVARYVAVGE